MKYLILLISIICFPAIASEKNILTDDCSIEYKKYDESHLAYSDKFAKKYKLSKESIEKMPEFLQFIELVIRSEFGKPACYLNMVIDNKPDIFKIPKEDFHVKRFNSFLNKYLALRTKQDVYDIASKTMWIEVVNFLEVQHDGIRDSINVFPYDLYIGDYSIKISSRLTQCSLGFFKANNRRFKGKEENGVLQIQKSNYEGTSSDIRFGGRAIDSERFYHTFILPEKWYERANMTISEIEQIRKDKKRCKNKEIDKLREIERRKENN